ncbi:MAG: ABC transporter ATP-binding protein [Candidatus Sumerlaeaceae bacterium]
MEHESPVILIENVTKRYGRTLAVENLTLEVRAGEVFGFVGENAAGKTTTIRMLLGHARPSSGSVRVLGQDPRDSRRAHLLMGRIGYVSESRAMYEWMRVREIMDFCAALHGARWDWPYAEKLRAQYGLDAQQRVKDLSRGKRALLMLLLAVAHHPELLILDEPSSGLDPVARREILEQVISVIQGQGRTVFFSSHLLDEVERVADRVGFMRSGHLVSAEPLEDLHERWRRLRIVWPEARAVPELAGIRRSETRARESVLTTDSYDEQMLAEIRRLGPLQVEAERMSLDDIFVESMRRPADEVVDPQVRAA